MRQRLRLVKAHANTRRRWWIDKAVFHLWRAGENGIRGGGTRNKLLNRGIVQMNIEMRIHRDPDRRHIARTMPRQTYTKGLTQHRQLQGRGDAANL